MASEAEKASSCQEHFQIRPYFAQVGRTERSMAAAGAHALYLEPDLKKVEETCGFRQIHLGKFRLRSESSRKSETKETWRNGLENMIK